MDKINLFQVGYNPTATRATNDLYCTNPKQVEKLLEYEHLIIIYGSVVMD